MEVMRKGRSTEQIVERRRARRDRMQNEREIRAHMFDSAIKLADLEQVDELAKPEVSETNPTERLRQHINLQLHRGKAS
jgi:hypothetical protein